MIYVAAFTITGDTCVIQVKTTRKAPHLDATVRADVVSGPPEAPPLEIEKVPVWLAKDRWNLLRPEKLSIIEEEKLIEWYKNGPTFSG